MATNKMRAWRNLYKTYKKQYNIRKSKSKVGMEERYTYYDFRTAFTSLENDIKKEIEKGERSPKNLNIMRKLVADQEKYEYSYKASLAAKRSAEKMGIKGFKLGEFRQGLKTESTNKFWELIRERTDNLLNSGMRWKEVDDVISEEYFGSPP